MEINGTNPHSTHAHRLANLLRTEKEVEEGAEQTSEGNQASEQTSESSDAQGVIRLLEEGHFKGVADVRLRINFFDKLTAIEAAQLQAVAEQKVDAVLESVGTIIETLVTESESAVESTAELPAEVAELHQTFTETVNQLKEDFLVAEAPSTAALVEGIQSAFDEFVEYLQAALAPETGDMTAQEATPEEGGGETGDVNAATEQAGQSAEPAAGSETEPDLQGFIAELKAAFEAAMDELANALSAVKVLPELSEPSGNGRAYQKFLAIYNEMRGVDTADGSSQGTEPLEAEG